MNELYSLMQLDRTLGEFGGYLDKIKVPFVLVCGTLLGLVREKQLIAKDKDIDVAIWEEDLTEEALKGIKESEHFGHDTGGEYGRGQMNFEKDGIHFDIFVIHKKGDKAFFNPGGDKCLVWDYNVLDKSKWKSFEYLGRKWNVPAKPLKFLDSYYGKNWRIPDDNWGWHGASNLMILKDI